MRQGQTGEAESRNAGRTEGVMAPPFHALQPHPRSLSLILTLRCLGHRVPIACFLAPSACCTRAPCTPALRQAAPSLPSSRGGSSAPCLLLLPAQASRGRSTQPQPTGAWGGRDPLSSLLAMGGGHSGPQLPTMKKGGTQGVALAPRDPLLLAGQEHPPFPRRGPLACLINKADKI